MVEGACLLGMGHGEVEVAATTCCRTHHATDTTEHACGGTKQPVRHVHGTVCMLMM